MELVELVTPTLSANPTPKQTLKDLEELGKKGLLKRSTPTKVDEHGRLSTAAAQPTAAEEAEERQLRTLDQMPTRVEALTPEEQEQLASTLAGAGDRVGVVV
jgi:hypothetical protein